MTSHTLTPVWTTGDRLRKARESAGIASAEMSSRLGVSRNTISNYEHDRTEPTLSTIRIWSQETGVSVGWLLGIEVGPSDQPFSTSACDGYSAEIVKFPTQSVSQVAA